MSVSTFGIDELANVVACMPIEARRDAASVLERFSIANVAAIDASYPRSGMERVVWLERGISDVAEKITSPMLIEAAAAVMLLEYNTVDKHGVEHLLPEDVRRLKRFRMDFGRYTNAPILFFESDFGLILASVPHYWVDPVADELAALCHANACVFAGVRREYRLTVYAPGRHEIRSAVENVGSDIELSEILVEGLERHTTTREGQPFLGYQTAMSIRQVRYALDASVRNGAARK